MSVRNPERENAAQVAAYRIREKLSLGDEPVAHGVVLGTGWGDCLDLKDAREVSLKALPGFESLGILEGHARTVVTGTLGGKRIMALRGRVHLNESHCRSHWKMVRLQVEMLVKLGVNRLVLTCAAGSLEQSLRVGDLMLMDGFVTAFAPPMPLLAGEFVSPEDALDSAWRTAAYGLFIDNDPKSVGKGGYALLRGPQFEGRAYDKKLLALAGAKAVGMSTLPEACVAALYPDVKVLGIAFITNSATETHSHEENLARAKARAAHLGDFLTRVIALAPR